MLKIAICDDDRYFLDRLVARVKKITAVRDRRYSVAGFSDGWALLLTDISEYDMFILDIQMPSIDGMTLAKKIREVNDNAIIIFLTALIEPAKDGYKLKAYDYILKPQFDSDFGGALIRALDELESLSDYILVKIERMDSKVLVSSIAYISSAARMVNIHSSSAETPIETYLKLDDLEEQLTSKGFIRCHQSFLVNVRYIYAQYGDFFLLKNNTEIPISKGRFTAAVTKYYEYKGGVQ